LENKKLTRNIKNERSILHITLEIRLRYANGAGAKVERGSAKSRTALIVPLLPPWVG